MIDLIEHLIADAYAAGFNGLRGAGDMTWVLVAKVTGKEILAYECNINRLFEQYPFMSMCQYDAGRFHADAVKMLIKTHPTVLHGGQIVKNPGYTPPGEFLALLEGEREMRIAV